MKAKEIARHFASLASFEPDMEVAILWWEQPIGDYGYPQNPTKEQWREIVHRFERNDYVSQEADEFFMREITELPKSEQ
jgi:hypothetical protein